MPLKGNAIVAQSGGPSAVINNSACGVIERWFEKADFGTIYAGIGGIKGILNGNIIDLAQQDVENIAGLRYTPGAGLFSCRYKVTDDDQRKMVEIFKQLDIRYFFYAGGNDSMDTAFKTWQAAEEAGWEMRVIGVPKTIDNDLPYTDHCPGYGSAAKYIATTVRETGIDLESLETKTKVTILEAMGRDAGWLTAAAALSRRFPDEAPHLIYLPEVPFSKDQFLNDVSAVYEKIGHCYVVASEGITDANGEYCFTTGVLDAFGHPQLSGVGIALKDLVENTLGLSARCNTPGTMQRAAMHLASKADADEAYMVGSTAVDYALEDKTGIMVTLERSSDYPRYICECGEVGLERVANRSKSLPLNWINQAGNYVTEDFINYCRPLVEGEIELPMRDGLPDFVRIDITRGMVKL